MAGEDGNADAQANPDGDASTLLTGEAGEEATTKDQAGADGKVDDQGQAGADDKTGAEDKTDQDGAPEAYEDFTLPEGYEFAEEAKSNFTELAKANNLTQAEAQKFVDLAAKHTQDLQAQQAKQYEDVQKAWVDEIKKDTDFGGSNYEDTITRAKRTLNSFGSKALFDLLDRSGYGNNPEIIKLLARVDKELGEDQSAGGASSGEATDKSAADTLYGGTK